MAGRLTAGATFFVLRSLSWAFFVLEYLKPMGEKAKRCRAGATRRWAVGVDVEAVVPAKSSRRNLSRTTAPNTNGTTSSNNSTSSRVDEGRHPLRQAYVVAGGDNTDVFAGHANFNKDADASTTAFEAKTEEKSVAFADSAGLLAVFMMQKRNRWLNTLPILRYLLSD